MATPVDKTPLRELYPDATLINNWNELKEFASESETHFLVIEDCSGFLNVKEEFEKRYDDNKPYDKQIENLDHYLSTHTFYGYTDDRFGGQYRESTKKLQACGFNVIIKNWDGETI